MGGGGGGGRRVFWEAVLWLSFNLPICLFGHTRGMPVIQEKSKVIYFIYM